MATTRQGFEPLSDMQGRTLEYLRFSLTDRCNFNCIYCGTASHHCLLSDDEVVRLATYFAHHGVTTIRLTGGESLMRFGVVDLVSRLKHALPSTQLTLSTNGYLLAPLAADLKDAGISGVNISIDATSPSLFAMMSGGYDVLPVLEAIERSCSVGIPVKLNCVPLRSSYTQQIDQLMHLAKEFDVPLRFIELMPIGSGGFLQGVTTGEVQAYLAHQYGEETLPFAGFGRGPAVYRRYRGVSVGFISALSDCFCSRCNRLRISASGTLFSCLCQETGLDLKALLEKGIDDSDLWEHISGFVKHKPLSHHFDHQTIANRSLAQLGG